MQVQFKSIKNRISVSIIVSSIFIIALITVFSYNMFRDIVFENFDKTNTVFVNNYATRFNEKKVQMLEDVESMASTLSNYIEEEERIEYLTGKLLRDENIYDYMFISDSKGSFVTTDGELGDLSDRDYFLENKNGETTISNLLDSKVTGKKIIIISTAIYNNGSFDGIIGGVINHEKFNSFLKSFDSMEKEDTVILLDGKGHVVNIFEGPVPMIPMMDYSNNENVMAHKLGENHYYSRVSDIESSWRIIYTTNTSWINKKIEGTMGKLVVAGLISLIIVFAYAGVLSKRISEPIVKLKEAFGKASTGDLNVRMNYESKDELGRASTGFNKMMDKIHDMTYNDILTGLSNLRYFNNKLENLIVDAKENRSEIGIIEIGVDKFKNVNSTLGIEVGDKLLMEISKKLAEKIGYFHSVCRVGGDEFALILMSDNLRDEIFDAASSLITELSDVWEIDDKSIFITVSAGISIYPYHGSDAVELIKSSNVALQSAKKDGGARLETYNDFINQEFVDQLVLENSIRNAVKNMDFYMKYHPIYSASEDEVRGIEALVRWNDKILGEVPPDRFIPVTEDNGLIIKLGDWILEKSIMDLMTFKKIKKDIYMSINISSIQLMDYEFVGRVIELIEKYDVKAGDLEFEITERVILDNSSNVLEKLKTLRMLGIRISLDDFGTGYSALSYLTKFELDTLKIDKSFVNGINSNKSNRFIVSTIIDIGKRLGIKVTAEGVETLENVKELKDMDCDNLQGYYYSKPLLKENMAELLVKDVSEEL